MRAVLAVVLCVAMAATGCTAQWIGVALADLPVLTQMALNIATLVTTMQKGQTVNPAEAAAIQNVSAEASRELNLLQTLYQQYKANPDASTLQKMQDCITELSRRLPQQLQAAHISDPALAVRVTAAVNLIVSTVESFAALMPAAKPVAARRIAIPRVRELKSRWNQQVCGASQVVGCEMK
jgi:hypothetical protein